MVALQETSKAPAVGIPSANSQPMPKEERMAWIAVVAILVLGAVSLYLLWVKADTGF